jgi:PAS domain S-box-containing protein
MDPLVQTDSTYGLWNSFRHSGIRSKLIPLVFLFIFLTLGIFYILNRDGIQNTMLSALLSTNMVIVFSMLWVVWRYIAKPVALIRNAAERLARGDINVQIDYMSNDESGMIIRDLNLFSKNLYRVSNFAEAIGKGQLQHEFAASGEHDKLGHSLIQMRDRIKTAADEDRRRNWATEGYARFGEILRNYQQDVHALADNIISNFVKYMNANQGALFIVDDEHEYLEMVGLYAWGKKRHAQKRFAPGESLASTVWQEKETLYLKEVPNNYVQITSGLGEANPTCVLIVPMKLNDQVFGIIEIASFKQYEPYQIAFAEKLAESIATTISSAKVNTKTKSLLEQTQQQAEQMKVQEEMMRQNMEELHAAQEEMARKNKEIERMLEISGQEAIEYQNNFKQTLLNILDQLPHKIFLKDEDGKMVIVNTSVARAHKMSVDELIGKSDFDFVDFETARQWRNQELEIIRKGSETYIFNETLAGETKTLKSTKMAFFIPHLKQTGLLGIQTDITELQQLKEMVTMQMESVGG